MISSEFWRELLGFKVQSLKQALNENRLKCLEHIFAFSQNDCLIVRRSSRQG